MQHLDGLEHLKGILRTKYDQFASLILPLRTWLEGKGVRFVVSTTVTDIHLDIEGDWKTVTSLEILQGGTIGTVPVAATDLVYFTNGSMTQNSTHGDNKRVATVNGDLDKRGAFTVWEKLAKVSPVFGRPEKFISTPDKSHFVSFTVTIHDYPELFRYLEQKTDGVIGSAGAVTLVDSPWFISFNTPPQPCFKGQPADVEVGSVAKIVKLEHAWRRLDGRNDDGFQVAPFPG